MGDTPTPRPLTTDEVVARAKFTISNLSREPVAWWDDEHCLDNGHAAMTVERLVATVEQLQADLAERTAERDAAYAVLRRCSHGFSIDQLPLPGGEVEALRRARAAQPQDRQ